MTNQKQIIEDAVEFITAGGRNSAEDALEYWGRGAEDNAKEAAENDWTRAGDWSQYWEEIGQAVKESYEI